MRLKTITSLSSVLFFCLSQFAVAQLAIPNASPVTVDFNSMGTSATANIPTGFKVTTNASIADYNAVTNTTNTTVVSTLPTSTTTGGVINYGESTTDRALGFLLSGTAGALGPRSILLEIENTGIDVITALNVAFDYEKYRSNNREMNFTFFHGSNSSNINIANTDGNENYPAVFPPVNHNPALRFSKTLSVTGLNLCPGQRYYFRWTLAGVGGSTNSHGLAIDNLVITPTLATNSCVAPTAPGAVTFGTVTPSNINVNWGASPIGNYMVFRSTSPTLGATPQNGTSYSVDDTLGNGTLVYSGSATTFNDSPVFPNNLEAGTIYYYFVYAVDTGCVCAPFFSSSSSSSFTATQPNLVQNLRISCSTNSSQQVTWDVPAGNHDGYIVLARQGGAPSTINTSFDPGFWSPNSNFSIAPIYNAGTTSKVMFIGTGTSVNITGLLQNETYFYRVYTYKTITPTTRVLSLVANVSGTVLLQNVTEEIALPENTAGTVYWTNPTGGCFDEVLAVVTTTPGLTFNPTGDGSLYAANSVYSGGNQVVLKGTGSSVTITNLVNGVTYYIEIYVRSGTEWSSGIEVSMTPSNATVFKPGDLVLTAYHNNLGGGDDGYRLLTFVDVNPGTTIIWANATYETGGRPAANERTDRWFTASTSPNGNVPFIRFTFNGPGIIPAGSQFCIVTDWGYRRH